MIRRIELSVEPSWVSGYEPLMRVRIERNGELLGTSTVLPDDLDEAIFDHIMRSLTHQLRQELFGGE